MSIGVRTVFFTTANLAVTSSTALVTTGLTSPIAAGQTQLIDAYLPFTVGAAGGVKMQVVVPAGGAAFVAAIELHNVPGTAQVDAIQTASAAFADAAANAGTMWIRVTGTIVNGSTAGNVDIQMAQNSSNATPMTLLRGASMQVTKL